MRDKKLSKEHTLHIQCESYLETHDEVRSQSPSQPSLLVELKLSTFQFGVLRAIPLCQPPHIKNKKIKKN